MKFRVCELDVSMFISNCKVNQNLDITNVKIIFEYI